MSAVKNRYGSRLLIVFGISFVTMVILLGGVFALGLYKGAPFAIGAHAATVSSCASTQGAQANLCELQDPIAQGCVADAETFDSQTVFQDDQQKEPIGEVALRYSPTCKSYWIRIMAFVTVAGVFGDTEARIRFRDKTEEGVVAFPAPTKTLAPYVIWTDMTMAPLSPFAGSGLFRLVGHSSPIIVTLDE